MIVGLFYCMWEKLDRESLPYVLIDNGTDSYLDRIHAVWLTGAYELVDEVEVPDAPEAEMLATIWEWFNRGSGHEHPDLDRMNLRSLSVSDIVRFPMTGFWLCRSLGWERILLL